MKSIMIMALGAGMIATPALAQNAQGMLNGLLSGNQNQDHAVQEAYERGYQKGRQDEARMRSSSRDNGPGYGQGYNGRSDDAPRGNMQGSMNQGRGEYAR